MNSHENSGHPTGLVFGESNFFQVRIYLGQHPPFRDLEIGLHFPEPSLFTELDAAVDVAAIVTGNHSTAGRFDRWHREKLLAVVVFNDVDLFCVR